MIFTVLLVDTHQNQMNLNIMADLVKDACLSIYPIKIIDYPTFKQCTETKEMSLYIMDKRDTSISSQNIQDINTLKDTFFGGHKTRTYTTCMSKTFDPRYIIIDIHDISCLGYKDKYLIRFILSEKLPISQLKICSRLAKIISKLFTCTIISNSKEQNAVIEAVTKFDKEKVVLHYIDLDQSGIIGKYTNENNISINKILEKIDSNIEILMAPSEIRENEDLLSEYKASYDFVKTISLKEETREIIKLQKDITAISNILSALRNMITKEPNVISHYARIYDPTKMVDYRVSEIKLNITNKEMWLP